MPCLLLAMHHRDNRDETLDVQVSPVAPVSQVDRDIIIATSRAWLLPPRHLLAAGFSAAASGTASSSSVRLAAQLAAPQLAFLADCRVLDRPLMPAAAWAEMIAAGCDALASGDWPGGDLVLADAVLRTPLDLQAAAARGTRLQSQVHIIAGLAQVSSGAASSAATPAVHLSTRLRRARPASPRVTVAGRDIHLRVRMQVLRASAATLATARSSSANVSVPRGQLESTGFAVHPGSAEAATSLGALPDAAGRCDGSLPGLAVQWDACLPRTAHSRHLAVDDCTVQASSSERSLQLEASVATVSDLLDLSMLYLRIEYILNFCNDKAD